MAFTSEDLKTLRGLFVEETSKSEERVLAKVSEMFKQQKAETMEMFKQQRKGINQDLADFLDKHIDDESKEHEEISSHVRELERVHPGGRHTIPGSA
ncbi:MAG: hypothetical protein HYW33_02110 [Candidatus Blackburnbacteria bacterium]|nr:hypothetical protein [Candidatus Blackburnbacteria bacterium]